MDFQIGDKTFKLSLLPSGVVAGQNVNTALKSASLRATFVRDFDDLRIPFRAVATDITTGEMVVLHHGDLAHALRASMSVPGIFAPVEVDVDAVSQFIKTMLSVAGLEKCFTVWKPRLGLRLHPDGSVTDISFVHNGGFGYLANGGVGVDPSQPLGLAAASQDSSPRSS